MRGNQEIAQKRAIFTSYKRKKQGRVFKQKAQEAQVLKILDSYAGK